MANTFTKREFDALKGIIRLAFGDKMEIILEDTKECIFITNDLGIIDMEHAKLFVFFEYKLHIWLKKYDRMITNINPFDTNKSYDYIQIMKPKDTKIC